MSTTFTSVDDTVLARVVSQARHRLVFVAPGVRQPVAKALAGAMSILPPEAIHLVLDVDAEVCRLGYGDTDLAGLTLLQQAASAHRLTVISSRHSSKTPSALTSRPAARFRP